MPAEQTRRLLLVYCAPGCSYPWARDVFPRESMGWRTVPLENSTVIPAWQCSLRRVAVFPLDMGARLGVLELGR